MLRPAEPPSSKRGQRGVLPRSGLPDIHFFVMTGSGSSRPTTLLKQTQGDGRLDLQGSVPPEGENLRQWKARLKGDLDGIHPNLGPSERRNVSGWMWWYVRLYVMIWCGRVMCSDRDQSVRSWGNVESSVRVELRDGVDKVMRGREGGRMDGRSERRRERRNERRTERRKEQERGQEREQREERKESVLRDIVTWNVRRMTMRELNRRD